MSTKHKDWAERTAYKWWQLQYYRAEDDIVKSLETLLRRAEKRGYERGVITMATNIKQASGEGCGAIHD